MGPLEGVLVIDMTRVMSGPYCTQMLGDLGARVIKIERPGKGDDTRAWGPPFQGEQSTYFLSCNRNKESLTLDIKDPGDKALLRRMIDRADVLVENFRPDTMERQGLGYETLKETNPGLVYARITGFGSRGPYRDRAGYDLIAQGMGGFMGLSGYPGGPPTKSALPIADLNAGMFLATGITSALFRREKTGRGQMVETSLYEGQLAQLVYLAGRVLRDPEDVPQKEGNFHSLIAPYATYETADGWVNLAVGSPGLWDRFCKALELDELHQDPRFVDNTARVENREALEAILRPALKALTSEKLLALMVEAGVPCGPVSTMDEVLTNPHTEALGLVVELPHSELGSVRGMAPPLTFSDTPGGARSGPPVLGEHSQALRDEFAE